MTMSWFSIGLLAIGTSADALAVSLAGNISTVKTSPSTVLRGGLLFGLAAAAFTFTGATVAWLSSSDPTSACRWSGTLLLAIVGMRSIRAGIDLKRSTPTATISDVDAIPIYGGAALIASVDCFAVGAGVGGEHWSTCVLVFAIGMANTLAAICGITLASRLSFLSHGTAECLGGILLVVFACCGYWL